MLDKIKKQLKAEWAYVRTLPQPYPWFVLCVAGVAVIVLILAGCGSFAT